jgi:hypothetical protein
MNETYRIRYVKETKMGAQAAIERAGVVVAFAQETADSLKIYWVDQFRARSCFLSPLTGRYREMSQEEILFEQYCAGLPTHRWNGHDMKQSQLMVMADAIHEWILDNREMLARDERHLKLVVDSTRS